MEQKMHILAEIIKAKRSGIKLLAILLDPEKFSLNDVSKIADAINKSPATHILVGGSSHDGHNIDALIYNLKAVVHIPVLLFPGNPAQISLAADGILFLSLLSGRNPEFLVGHQVTAAPMLMKSRLEVIPTAYILVDGGKDSAVAKISKTTPIDANDIDTILATAQAGQLMGNALAYLEAGSGAKNSIALNIIEKVSNNISVPLIVGGGINSRKSIEGVFAAGADMVVIGTAFEEDVYFFEI